MKNTDLRRGMRFQHVTMDLVNVIVNTEHLGKDQVRVRTFVQNGGRNFSSTEKWHYPRDRPVFPPHRWVLLDPVSEDELTVMEIMAR